MSSGSFRYLSNAIKTKSQLLKAIQATMSDRKVALITGITGQDGSYLTELLLEKGYEVSRMNAVTMQQLSYPQDGGATKRMHDLVDL